MSGLGVSFWRDEIYSVVHYSSRGPGSIWFGHYVAGDHVLFNFLSWLTTAVVGRSEATYRLWSVVPAIAAVALVTWWLWRTWSRWLAVVFGCLAVTSPLQLELAKQARGYGLGFLAGAGMLCSAIAISRAGGRRAWTSLAVAGLVGVWTLTGFAIAFVGQLVSLFGRRQARRATAIVLAVFVAGGLVFYAPMLGAIVGPLFGRANYFHADVGQPLRWSAFLLGPSKQFLAPTFERILHVHSAVVYQAVGLGLAGSGAGVLWRSGERLTLLVLVVPLVFTEIALTVLGVNVNPRYLSFLLFHFLVLIALGVLAWGRLIARARVLRPAVVLTGVAFLAVFAVQLVRLNEHWDAVPIENFKQVAAVVHRDGVSDVVTDSSRPRGLRYYLGSRHVQVLPAAQLVRLFCHAPPPLAFVDHLAYRSGPVDLSCLQARGARRVKVRQRDQGLPVYVWLLGSGVVVRLTPPAAPTAVVSPCAKRADYLQYPLGRAIAITGSLQPTPSGHVRVKVKVKRCAGGFFGPVRSVPGSVASAGRFNALIPPLPAGFYEARATAKVEKASARSEKVYFQVGAGR